MVFIAGRDYAVISFKLALACLALIPLTFLAIILLDWTTLFTSDYAVSILFSVFANLNICIALFLSVIGQILLLFEVATSKNILGWKARWILILLFLVFIGAGIYFAVGRKKRKV